MNNEDIIYFELNNWIKGDYYPDAEPFITWFKDDCTINFDNEDWVKENRLCVVFSLVDMSFNYCITATKKWVLDNCPELLTKYTQFLRFPDESDGIIYGNFGTEFLNYSEANIGVHFQDIYDT